MNHPNAFTDPIAITYVSYPLRVHYMARGDVFKAGVAGWLLEQIGIIPIFRLHDAGKEGLKKNDESYQKVNELLKKNAKVIVFAEGFCVQERRLRPLKKGVARMVFGAYDYLKNDRLMVIPVGVNYSNPCKFRSKVLYNVGEPIYVRDLIAEYRDHPARAQKRFLHILEPAMKSLITHINKKEDDEVVYMVEKLCKKDWLRNASLDHKNLSDDLLILQLITKKVNAASDHHPDLVEEFRQKAKLYFAELKKYKMKDWQVDPEQNKQITTVEITMRLLLLIAGLPIYITGMAANFPPLFLTGKITGKLVRLREFYSSFAIGFGMVIFPLTYFVWFVLIYSISPNVLWPFAVCLLFGLSGAFCLSYHPFMLKTVGMIRLIGDPSAIRHLEPVRKELLALINKF